jgi:hypothetical protein
MDSTTACREQVRTTVDLTLSLVCCDTCKTMYFGAHEGTRLAQVHKYCPLCLQACRHASGRRTT